MKTRKLLFTILLFTVIIPTIGFSQTVVRYDYDEAGNRILRAVIVLKTTENDSLKTIQNYEGLIGETKITVYPNPNQGSFSVEFSESLNNQESTDIYIHDLNGKEVYKKENLGILTNIDISYCEKGIYFMTIVKDTDKKIWKIIKQ